MYRKEIQAPIKSLEEKDIEIERFLLFYCVLFGSLPKLTQDYNHFAYLEEI